MGFSVNILSGRRSFINELRPKLPATTATAGLDAAVSPLNNLPYQWWPQALKIVARAVRRGGIRALQERLANTFQWCRYVPPLGLHMRSSLAQLRRAYYIHPELHSRLPNLGRLIKFHTRSIERVGQELMIHRLKGQERISALGKDAWRHHETHISNALRNARTGVFQRPLASKAAASERASIASFHSRAHGAVQWAVHDLGYVCRRWFITCPQAFHACHIGGDVNPAWLALGRPSPARANRFLSAVLSLTRRKCQRLCITPIGPKTIEAHESGTPHINLVLAFSSEADAEAFDAALRAAYARVAARYGRLLRQPLGFAVTQQAIVAQVVVDLSEAVGYALKNVVPSESAALLPNNDREWCKLWGIRQFDLWGLRDGGKWQRFRRLHPTAMEVGVYPEEVQSAWSAAIAGDYRSWLRITHASTPDHLRVIVGKEDQDFPMTHLVCVSQSDSSVHISINNIDQFQALIPLPVSAVWWVHISPLNPTSPATANEAVDSQPEAPPSPPPRRRQRPKFSFTAHAKSN